MIDREFTEAKRRKLTAAAGAAVAALALSSCVEGPVVQEVVTVTVTVAPDRDTEDGPCEPMQVYAQNRWDPQGASKRENPFISADKIGSYGGNEAIAVDGWRDTDVRAYPENPAPWNSDIWLHTNDGGWVSFAGVRKKPTQYDPTGTSKDGGVPVTLLPECEM